MTIPEPAAVSSSILTAISEAYYSLTASEKKIADHVTAHLNEVQSMSISELAAACDIAEATVSRFCRSLGCKSYNEFKLAVAKTAAGSSGNVGLLGEVKETDTFSEMCQKLYGTDAGAISQTLELINEQTIVAAADCLESASTVFCMGQGGSMILAEEAAHLFTTCGSKFFPVHDAHMQAITAANMNRNDVILFFSYSGATREMLETVRIAKGRGARVILITRYPKSPGAALCDIVLQCGSNESPIQLGSIAARIAQMFLLDVLFSELCRRNLRACRASRERVAEALAEKHL